MIIFRYNILCSAQIARGWIEEIVTGVCRPTRVSEISRFRSSAACPEQCWLWSTATVNVDKGGIGLKICPKAVSTPVLGDHMRASGQT